MAKLKKIEIKGFRSIAETSLDLRPLNVLIGANGSGKSNLVSFFKLLNEMMAGRLQEYIARTGRGSAILHFGPKTTPDLEGVLTVEGGEGITTYSMRLIHSAGDTLQFAREELTGDIKGWGAEPQKQTTTLGSGHAETKIVERTIQVEETAKVIRRILDACRVYHFHDTSPTSRSRQFCYINDNRWLRSDGGNLAAMLFAYRQQSEPIYRRIVSTVRKILPEFDTFDLEPNRLNPNEIILNWRKRGYDYLFGPHQISDGSLRSMALCTLFLQPEADLPDIIILDEPELGLHPHALEMIAGLMRAASLRTQVIVATQSQTFLNFFEPEEVITVECRQGRSRFHRLNPDELKDWLEDYSIGELWQRNVIGGGPLP